MSDDLYARMQAAAKAAIETSAPAEEAAPEAPAEETATLEASDAPAADEQPVEAEAQAGEENAEAAPEETEEETEEGQPDVADQILAVRQAAERRVRQAEARARELEAKLEKADERVNMSRKEVVEDIFRKLRRAPARTFKEFGFDFQELIDAGMREGQFHDGTFSEIDEVKQQIRELQKEREELRAQKEEQQQRQMLQEARREFLGQVSEREYPTLFNMFQDDPEPLWIEAQRIAELHEEQHGEAPDDRAVIRHLEAKYKARLERLSGKAAPAAATSTPAAKKTAGAKTISTKAASETRTAGKPFGQLSAEEQRAALVAAVNKSKQAATN